MRLQGVRRSALRVVEGHLASLAALLLGATLLLSPRGAAAQDLRNFNVQNSSGLTIVEFYVSEQNRTDWGDNVLIGPIPPGGVGFIRFSGRSPSGFVPCAYDMLAVTNDGQTFEARGMDVCAGDFLAFPAQFTFAGSVRPGGPVQSGVVIREFFWLQNTSPVAIVGLSVRPSGTGAGWSEIVLASGAILPGQQQRADFVMPSCVLDVQVRTSNGQSNVRPNVDLCSTDVVNFSGF